MISSVIKKINEKFTFFKKLNTNSDGDRENDDPLHETALAIASTEIDTPESLKSVRDEIQKSVDLSREMVISMMNVASEAEGLSISDSERLLSLCECDENGVADAQKLAEALVYSQSPLKELHASRQLNHRKSTTKASVLVIHAALIEQQYADHRLRNGVCFSAEALYKTLLEWVYKGSHRPGLEGAPLTEISKTIDLTSQSIRQSHEVRFGCVIPALVSVQILEILQRKSNPDRAVVAQTT